MLQKSPQFFILKFSNDKSPVYRHTQFKIVTQFSHNE